MFKKALQFKKITPKDIDYFSSILGKQCITDPDTLKTFNLDWMRKYKGNSSLLLKPKTTEQVSQILRYCNQENLAVVPQGGNTGLVGGSVPVDDEIILSMQSMNQIRSFDSVSGILTCDAGCILETLDNYVAERGFIMPIDLGAKGSCHLGGNIATNAGGLRLLRYGSLHGTVLSLEVVLADGRILQLGRPLRKDNTGYDLKQLFIGSEGTLGVITGCSILTPPRPKAVNVAVLAVPSYEHVQEIFKKAKMDLGEILSAFEFFDTHCMDLVEKHLEKPSPFGEKSPFYVLIETSGSNKEHDDQKLDQFVEQLMEHEMVGDGVLAQDQTQIQHFWSIREGIPEACAKEGGNFKYDLSVPLEHLYPLVQDMQKHLNNQSSIKKVVGFGHMGDGNVHLNIMTTGWTKENEALIEPYIYEQTQKYGGSISAEHGLGLMKAPFLHYSQPKESIQMMQQIKKLWDPKGILNPYKYIPQE
ncbi:hypothetical protein EDD86DRAFT_203201 [Gorgonomyces haynaldii]|nr:hypothetical protein EDD86DRAFT_203201 [Gorgonomyces haynaldii]